MEKLAPTTKKSGYLPSLDGWRAIAVLGVLIAHEVPWKLFGHSTAGYNGIGGNGVQLFFAISGFLITTRILEEERLVGYFDIKRFYIRRIFRIQPAALAYLAVVALLIAFGVVHDRWYHWFAAVFMFQNFTWFTGLDPLHYYFTGHFWTLAVEEHFYILLSLVLFFFRKNRVLVLAALYFGFVMGTHLAVSVWHVSPEVWPRRTYWQIHLLLLPALMAAILQWQPALVAVKRFLQPWVAFTFTVAFPLLHLEFYHLRHKLPLFPVPVRTVLLLLTVAAINYGFLLWILATVFHPRSWTTRLLEMRVFRFVGRISYSLYLWHVLFFFRSHPQSAITNPVLLFLSQPGLRWMMAFSVATLSYYFIEKPLIRLGHRLAPPATPGRLELADLPVEAPAPGWELPAT